MMLNDLEVVLTYQRWKTKVMHSVCIQVLLLFQSFIQVQKEWKHYQNRMETFNTIWPLLCTTGSSKAAGNQPQSFRLFFPEEARTDSTDHIFINILSWKDHHIICVVESRKNINKNLQFPCQSQPKGYKIYT